MARTEVLEWIARKRDGGELTESELAALIDGYLRGDIADYQMSAWLMAVCLRGLTDQETHALTNAMLTSGERLTFPDVLRPLVDKHSTGGVGDKVSLCLIPLAAACGLHVPSISGRGLGHTGGTLDKLDAIPGFRHDLSLREIGEVVARVGCCMTGQTAELAPADRRMYALRDVTGTVESVPLIVASILSKKLAAGLDGLVLDVKTGSGAFMQDLDAALRLGRALVTVGRRMRVEVTALVTDMDAPLGQMIGNALELREALEVLRGEGPRDTRELTLTLAAEMLTLGDATLPRAAALGLATRALDGGQAFSRFVAMVAAQGGDARVLENPSLLPAVAERLPVRAPVAGRVERVDAKRLGVLAMRLGAGRSRVEESIDPAVGIELAKKPGDEVEAGEPLAWLHAHPALDVRALAADAVAAYRIGGARTAPVPLVLGRVRGAGERARASVPPPSRRAFAERKAARS